MHLNKLLQPTSGKANKYSYGFLSLLFYVLFALDNISGTQRRQYHCSKDPPQPLPPHLYYQFGSSIRA